MLQKKGIRVVKLIKDDLVYKNNNIPLRCYTFTLYIRDIMFSFKSARYCYGASGILLVQIK